MTRFAAWDNKVAATAAEGELLDLRAFAESTLARFLGILGRLDPPEDSPGRRAVILAYHRVLPGERLLRFPYLEDLVTPAESFAEQAALLARSYRVLPLEEVVHHLQRGRALPARAVSITFDDGYADNYEFALPLLRQHRLPATVFLATGYVGNERGLAWWDEVSRWRTWGRREIEIEGLGRRRLASRRDRDRLLGQLKRWPVDTTVRRVRETTARIGLDPSADALAPFLSWEQVREMQGEGISFGSHTVSHALLPVEAPERRQQELAQSRSALERETGGSCSLFCYPSGASDDAVAQEVRDCGYLAAVLGQPGDLVAGLDLDLFRLPRKTVNHRVALTTFRFKLSPQSERIKHRLALGARRGT